MSNETEHGEAQAKAQFESIAEMVKGLDHADPETRDSFQQQIYQDPLSVQVRSGWYSPTDRDADKKPLEFELLLMTGGPAVRIIGELDSHLEPEKARIEHQDWFTPWRDYPLNTEQTATLLTYCRQFYFGEA